MLHFGKWNWGNSTKKYYGKFEKMAFRKSHEKGVEAQKFFPIERKIWGRTTPKMKFLLKYLALPEGGGVGNSCKNCRNRFFGLLKFLTANSLRFDLMIKEKMTNAQKRAWCMYVCMYARSLLKFLATFPQFLQNFRTPPLWKSHNFEKKFHFRGRSTSDFSLNWEEFLNFDTLSGPFQKATFLNFP